MNLSCSNQDACPVILDSKCVIYEGENLLYIGVNTNDNFRFALEQINSTIGNLILTGGISQLVGDVIAVGPGIAAATLATVNSTTGTFGSSTAIPKVTVNGKGLITHIETVAVSIPSGSLNFIGDVTGSGNTGSNTTLTLATVNSNTYLSNNFLKFAVNGKGLVTSATPVTSGDIITALGYTPYNSTNPSNFISRLGLSAVTPLSYNSSNGQFSIQQADGTHDGYLSSIDWNTFNSKQNAGLYITNLTGEASGSGPGVANVTLSNAAVIAKVLTGLNITGGTVVDTDSLLIAIGKIQNQLNALYGGSIYQGVWNASTNSPALTSGVGTKGHYYIVNVPGTTDLDGITDWNLGDWAIFDGTVWQQVDNTDAVVSVNGYTGAVSLTTDDIPQGLLNQYFTNSKARLALSGGTGISYDNSTGIISSTITQYTDALARQAISLTTIGTSGAATYNNITGVLNIPNYASALTGYVPYTGATSNVNLETHGITADYFQLSTSPSTTGAVGQMWWNATDGTMNIGMGGGNATQQVGQETYYPYVVNTSGALLPEGTLVMANPAGIAQGNRISVVKAISDGTYPAEMMLGILTEDIGNNQQGFCTWFGYVRNLSLSGTQPAGETWVEGDILYGNPTIPGKLTNVTPSAPAVKSTIAIVSAINGNNLTLMVRPHFSSALEEIDNVGISGIANNQGLFWDTNKWVNKTIATALGYTPVPTTRTLTINGTTYDLSADRSWTISGGLSGSGTTNYIPKFTGSTALGNSSITDDGSTITLNNLTSVIYSDNSYQGLNIKNTNTGTSALAGITIQNPSGTSVAQMNYVPTNYANTTLQNTFLFNTVLAQKLAFATNSGGGGTRADIYFTVNPAFSLSSTNPNQIHIIGSSKNVIINYSGTDSGEKFQINGTTKITDVLTLGSTISNGTYTYTLPGATGTLALASSLSSYVPTSRTLTINGVAYDLSADRSWTISSGVSSFNTRTGAVTLTSSDVTSALGFTPQNSSTAITTSNIGSQSVSYASSAGSVAWGNVSSKPSNIMYYQGFTLNADTMDSNSTGFTYAVNAPYTGPIARFSANGSYDLQINASYSGGTAIAYRTRNGDTSAWNSWYGLISSANIGSQSVNYANYAGYLGSSNYIQRTGSSGDLNTDFQNTPAGTGRYQGDDANLANSPGGTWWIYQNFRHGNGANYWGTQVAWGWEDNANRLATRNVTGGSFGGWVYYMNTSAYPYAASMNQHVRTSDGPTFTNIYNSGWFRNNNSNEGLYNQSTTMHWSSNTNAYWDASSTGGVTGIRFYTGGHVTSLRGFVYADSSNNIGFLNSGGSWSLRCDNSGNVVATGDITAFSDARVKENVKTIDNALDKVLALRGVSYTRNDSEDKRTKIGVIAQETLPIVPEVVNQDNDGMYNVSYGNLGGLFIEAFKEQQVKIKAQDKIIEELKKVIYGNSK